MQVNFPATLARWATPRSDLIGFTTQVTSLHGADGTLALPSGAPGNAPGAANRQLLTHALSEANATEAVAVQWLQQVHGNQCVYATSASVSQVPVADAAWTDQVGVALAIQTADCVPVLIAHEQANLIGAAHGGWRGLLDGVLESLIGALPVAPDQLQAWIGPCISVQHFEVGADVWQPVLAQCPEAVFAHPTDSAKRMVDLVCLTQSLLQKSGVHRITGANCCTYADPCYYSHRQITVEHGAEATTGRMASVIMLRESADSIVTSG